MDKNIGPQIKLQLDQILDQLTNMQVGQPLVWLWCWDAIRDRFREYSSGDLSSDYIVPEHVSLDDIFEKLYASPPADFTLEYGPDQLDEAIMDWMIDNEFLTVLDDDGWLDDVEQDEPAV